MLVVLKCGYTDAGEWHGVLLGTTAATVVITSETMLPAVAATVLVSVLRAAGVGHFVYVASAQVAAEQRAECALLLRVCRQQQVPCTVAVPATFFDDFLNVWPVTQTFWRRRLVWWGVPLRLESTACTFLPLVSRDDFGTIVLGVARQPAKNDTLYVLSECASIAAVLAVLSRSYGQPVLYHSVPEPLREQLGFPDRPSHWDNVNQARLELSSAVCHSTHPDCETFEQWADRMLPEGVDAGVARANARCLYWARTRTVLLWVVATAAIGIGATYMLQRSPYVRSLASRFFPEHITTSIAFGRRIGSDVVRGVKNVVNPTLSKSSKLVSALLPSSYSSSSSSSTLSSPLP
jgi:hypothetical protein